MTDLTDILPITTAACGMGLFVWITVYSITSAMLALVVASRSE